MKKTFLAIILFTLICSTINLSVFATDYNSEDVIQEVQAALNEAGFDCGTPDGIAGKKTAAAVAAYRAASGLPEGSEIDEALYNQLVSKKAKESDNTSQNDNKTTESVDSNITVSSKNRTSYSTNDKDTAKNGDKGVYAYSSKGGSYKIYYIIDFDEQYVYYFTEGNGESTCEKVKMDSGTLNDVLIITYHDGGDEWSYGLHFKWKNQPDHLVVQDEYGFEYDFYTTDLEDALKCRSTKTIVTY